ncbi:hypothetical protein MVEG_12439 [Podila verticillata NRRL 6337]|jgi:hypothetical protein|uniref:Uncharacterized protein n=1 Tax=Podila verticillata NRRL 6337 TaxID=1069443 RepID=A0A086TIE6_9FUNG|nr:hypothetical protein MVEG_12439 [Podila verticillata NRRL 6337]
MDYYDIREDIKKYVKKSTYNKLDDDEKRAYMKAVKYVVKKMREEMTSTDDSNSTDECMWPISVEVIVVDSTDILDPYTKVKLEMNDGKKGNSIKVMMKDDDDGEWKHVAYVRESDAINLMKYKFLDKKIRFIDKLKSGYKYRVFL